MKYIFSKTSLVILTLIGLSHISSAQSDQNSLAINEPPCGMWVGINKDIFDKIGSFNRELGFNLVSDVIYTGIPVDEWWIRANAKVQREQNGGLLWLTVIADRDYLVDDVYLDKLASILSEEEAKGSSFMLCIGHEMNLYYNRDLAPKAFKSLFKRCADKVHQATTKTAMVWVPNVVNETWPWGGVPPFGSEEWHELDANNNWYIDWFEGYDAFYPGDEYVDWVGMDVYHMESTNVPASARQFATILDNHFYPTYCEDKGKPMAIMETAATWRPELGGNELEVKSSWFDQIFHVGGDTDFALDISEHYPKLKWVSWFDRNKETDWRITGTTDPEVTRQWLSLLQTPSGGKKHFLESHDFIKYRENELTCSLLSTNVNGAPLDQLTVAPNPTNGAFCIKSITVQAGEVSVFDHMGRPVDFYVLHTSENGLELLIADAKPGVYFVRPSEHESMHKVIVKPSY